MIWITGDTHGDFSRFETFCKEHGTTTDDIMIILGDVGLNYFAGNKSHREKEKAARYPLTFFCIHGNHERRPSSIKTYRTGEFHGGRIWYEEEFPNLIFARDGEIFNLDGHDTIVIGGAYSVDKYIRLERGWEWFPNEQPSQAIKVDVEAALNRRGWAVDTVLSHTCPRIFEPTEIFDPCFDDSLIDKSTEDWLAMLESRMSYNRWFCGHFHIEKRVDKLRFMYEEIDEF